MNRRERRKQQKKKERQERLRQEKHVRPALPQSAAEDEFEDADVDSPEDFSEPAPVVPSRFNRW